MESKRGQMKISFGMIFSILLIVMFLAFAGYGITKFLGMKDNVQIKQFQENLELEVEKMWKSDYGTQDLIYTLPTKYDQVCFKEPDVVEVHSDKRIEKINLDHVEIEGEDGKEFFCIKTVNNRVGFTLEKTYGEPLVKVVR